MNKFIKLNKFINKNIFLQFGYFISLDLFLFNSSLEKNSIMALPELIYAPIEGGTIHRYELSGGKRKFLRFIGCYLGRCNFFENIDDAIEHIKNLKGVQNIQKN